jgi:hypothetical protein
MRVLLWAGLCDWIVAECPGEVFVMQPASAKQAPPRVMECGICGRDIEVLPLAEVLP